LKMKEKHYLLQPMPQVSFTAFLIFDSIAATALY